MMINTCPLELLQLNRELQVGLGHVEADLVKILGYLQVPGSGCLLEAVEGLFQSTYYLRVCARLEAWWLYHVVEIQAQNWSNP